MKKEITESKIHNFEQTLRESEHSEATIEKYTAALRNLMYFLQGEEITKIRLIKFRDMLKMNHSAQTVNGAISAINGYLDMIGLSDCKLKLLKVQKQDFCLDAKEMTREEYNRLVNAARQQKRYRLLLLMETICATGIRVSEVKYITVEAAKSGKAEIAMKGKIRTILLPHKLCKKLLVYAKRQGVFSGEIFLTRNGTSLSRKQIWAEMKAICEEAKVEPGKVFPHNLRHLFARCFYQSSKDIVKLSNVLGHSSVETTRIYLKTTEQEHLQTLDRLRLVS